MPKRFAAYPIGIAATSIASVVVVSRRPGLDRGETEVVLDRRQQRHERRLRDAVDEREGEQDAELEIEAMHAFNIVTADRFVKCE